GTVETIEEGSVLPETYAYDRGMARSVLVARARQAMERELAAAWANRSPDLQLSSPRELLILASIVERETSRPDERARVAAVYLNRLRIGMRLQADPTVVYAASNGAGVLDRKLTKADLERQDPYNTYRNAGLPPGPICSPGAASLAAVARPAKTEELFFVADGQGGHVFSRTWEAHERNVARWRALTGGPVATD
ncbi:MAG: endolytic transglycosylase MltG, partial [Acetobacteraceae bacterium]